MSSTVCKQFKKRPNPVNSKSNVRKPNILTKIYAYVGLGFKNGSFIHIHTALIEHYESIWVWFTWERKQFKLLLMVSLHSATQTRYTYFHIPLLCVCLFENREKRIDTISAKCNSDGNVKSATITELSKISIDLSVHNLEFSIDMRWKGS